MGSHIRSATGLGFSRGSLLCLPHSGASLAGVGPQGSPEDITMVMGKHSLRLRIAGVGSRVPRPAIRPDSSSFQALGHPSAVGCCGRAENGVGAQVGPMGWI